MFGLFRKVSHLVKDQAAKGQARSLERERMEAERLAQEKQQVLQVLPRFVDTYNMPYTPYEYNEVKRNLGYFQSLAHMVLEPDEQGITFVQCEFDKTKKREMRGFLLVTSKRVLFVDYNRTVIQKCRYQTIRNVTWFKDGLLERGLHIQYGVKRLEFDEMFDQSQMMRVGNQIKQRAPQFPSR